MSETTVNNLEDLDFENFKVEASRAQLIRERVLNVKNSKWLECAVMLLKELGQVDQEAMEDNGGQRQLSGIKAHGEDAPRIYAIKDENHPAFGIVIRKNRSVYSVDFGSWNLLQLQVLPKENDFLVLHLEDEYSDFIEAILEALEPEMKRARSVKQERVPGFLKN